MSLATFCRLTSSYFTADCDKHCVTVTNRSRRASGGKRVELMRRASYVWRTGRESSGPKKQCDHMQNIVPSKIFTIDITYWWHNLHTWVHAVFEMIHETYICPGYLGIIVKRLFPYAAPCTYIFLMRVHPGEEIYFFRDSCNISPFLCYMNIAKGSLWKLHFLIFILQIPFRCYLYEQELDVIKCCS